jgi:sec-independent protein translocase protein TatC
VTFEVPVIVVVLNRMGVVKLKQLRDGRSYVIVGAFVVAAVVTPPDVLSQVMMALPLWLLYEVGIVMSMLVNKEKPDAAHD